MRISFIALALFATPCSALSCDQAWNYASCAYPALHVAGFDGATAGDKIAACVAALPATGGICDARDLPPGSTIPSITLSASGVTILGPCGQVTVSGSINIYNPAGISAFQWIGCGASAVRIGTNFIWDGDSASSMFRIRGVRDSSFSDFVINSSGALPLATGIQVETATGTVSTNHHFTNIIMQGTNANGLQKGMRWCVGDDCGGAGTDNNNDLDFITSVQINNYSNCAFSIEGTQSKSHTFLNSTFAAGPFGQRGVCTTQAANPARNSGSFRWFGGGGGSNSVADFDIGNPDDAITIQSCNMENSNRLLQTAGPASAFMPINIVGCRFAANMLNADNNVVFFQFRGILNLIGNTIDSTPAGRSPQFYMRNSSALSRATATGNVITWGTATSLSNPFAGDGPAWETRGNVVVDASGNQFAIPDVSQ